MDARRGPTILSKELLLASSHEANGDAASAAPPRRRRGPVRLFLDLFSSVTLGIGLLTFLFLYMSVGSAGYLVRQMRVFEMTEYEWFHWWPFNLAIALLVINLVVVTLRRIPFKVVNLGVWMIHTGIVILCVASVAYFGLKVEGDAPVFRRMVVIESPNHAPVELIALPGASVVAGVGPDAVRYSVSETRPDWPILSGDDAGKRVYSVSVSVAPAGGGPGFVRQLLDGHPQYTEDILPGQGRAIKATGKALVDDTLTMRLAQHEQRWFYHINSWALYSRRAGETDWAERPIHHLPRYNDYIASRDWVWLADGEASPPIDPLDIAVRQGPTPDALGDAEVRITGFLRYAVPEQRWLSGGVEINPIANLRLTNSLTGDSRDYELAAFDMDKRSAEGGELVLRWIDDEAELADIGRSGGGGLTLAFPGAGQDGAPLVVSAPPEALAVRDPAQEPAWISIEGTEFSYRVREVVDELPMNDGRLVSIAVVDVSGPEGELTRWASNPPELTRDFVEEGDGQHALQEPAPWVQMSFSPPRLAPRVTIVAGPGDGPARLAISDLDGGEPRIVTAPVGEPILVDDRVVLTMTSYAPTARLEQRPMIVPVSQRDKDAASNYSMIRVEITRAGRTVAAWLPFHMYAFDDANYAYGGRFRYSPTRLRLPDGAEVELLFGRERDLLPAPVVLDDFRLIAHVGGFTGRVSSIRDWESVIRFRGEDGLSPALSVKTNNPAGYEGFRLFQAMWDPPEPGFTAGLNFTGLGIGNRVGVVAQLAGCTLSVIGMLYAFYVKPVIKRRRQERVWAEVEAKRAAGEPLTPARAHAGAMTAAASTEVSR